MLGPHAGRVRADTNADYEATLADLVEGGDLMGEENGLRSTGRSTAVPSVTLGARMAMAASSVRASCRGRATSESPTQTESNPRSSALAARSKRGAASGRPVMMYSRVGST